MSATPAASRSDGSVSAPGPFRVTHVITRLIVGGAQENTVSTVLGLQQKNEFSVELIAGPTTGPEGSLEEDFKNCSGALHIVPTIIRPVRPWTDLRGLFDLKQVFERARPTIVHTHSGKAGVLG